MRRPCWPLLVFAFWPGLTSPCLAQGNVKSLGLPIHNYNPEHRSHFQLDNLGPLGNIEQSLLDRLQRAQQLRDTPPLLRGLLQNENLREQLKNKLGLEPGDIDRLRRLTPGDPELGKLLKDPRWQKLLKELTQSNGGLPINFNELAQPDKLKGLLERLKLKDEDLKGLFEELVRKNGSETNPLEQPNGILGPGGLPLSGNGNTGSSATSGDSSAPQTPRMSDRLKEFMTKNLDRLADGLQRMDYTDDSQALREAIRQFKRVGFSEGDLNLDRFSPGQLETLDRVGRWISPETLGSVDWPGLAQRDWGLRLPSLRGSLPQVGMPSLSAPSWARLPSTRSLPNAGSIDTWVWIAMLALLVLLLWKWNDWFQRKDADQEEPWRLGPWPVAPNRVTTRGDLVRAFEYLALFLLGPDASTHHHRDLAQQIDQQAATTPADHEVIAQLARLYEQARYAPEQADADVPLSQDEQAFARHTLCLLAGQNPV